LTTLSSIEICHQFLDDPWQAALIRYQHYLNRWIDGTTSGHNTNAPDTNTGLCFYDSAASFDSLDSRDRPLKFDE